MPQHCVGLGRKPERRTLHFPENPEQANPRLRDACSAGLIADEEVAAEAYQQCEPAENCSKHNTV